MPFADLAPAVLALIVLVATVAALGFGLNLTKSVVFGLSPPLTPSLMLKGVLIGLYTIPGAYAGRWIVRNTPIRIHTLFLEFLILYGPGYFLPKAAEGLGA